MVARVVRQYPLLCLVGANALGGVFGRLLAPPMHRRQAGGLRLCLEGLVPGRGERTRRMTHKVRERIKSIVSHGLGEPVRSLPAQGSDEATVVDLLRTWSEREAPHHFQKSSGVVFGGQAQVARVLAEATRCYAWADAAHPDAFPSVRKMEAEVVAMMVALFHGGSNACGTMAGSATEAVLLACKAYRDIALEDRGITAPELVLPETAHAIFSKAAHFLGVRTVRVPVDGASHRADVDAMEAAITPNTILLVASAPSYAQGVVDPVVELAALARRREVPLHVDCCCGGFLLPMLADLGMEIAPFDFAVDGVSSISCTLHKYGFAPVGASVILYASPALRCARCAPDPLLCVALTCFALRRRPRCPGTCSTTSRAPGVVGSAPHQLSPAAVRGPSSRAPGLSWCPWGKMGTGPRRRR